MDLTELRRVEMEILSVFHDICRKHSLRYSLAYGTLLGCVRHQGFIPWDDDIDVMMPVEDYRKFLEIGQEELGDRYFLQHNKNDRFYRNSFAKIRKNNTCAITKYTRYEKHSNHGIYIDIFPITYLPRNKFIQKIQEVILNIIGQINTTFCFEVVKSRKFKVIKFILLCLHKIIPYRLLALIEDKLMAIGTPENSDLLCGIYPELRGYLKKCVLEKDTFDHLLLMKFEDGEFFVPRDYDRILRRNYGEYWILPPEEKRRSHYFLAYDTKRSYQEYMKEKAMVGRSK